MKKISFVIAFLIAVMFLTACSGKEAEVEVPEFMNLNFESYATVKHIFDFSMGSIEGIHERNTHSIPDDTEFENISVGEKIGIIIPGDSYDSVNYDISDSGQKCTFSGIEFGESGRISIDYRPSTNNLEFLNYCINQSPKTITVYLLTKNDEDSVNVERKTMELHPIILQ